MSLKPPNSPGWSGWENYLTKLTWSLSTTRIVCFAMLNLAETRKMSTDSEIAVGYIFPLAIEKATFVESQSRTRQGHSSRKH